MGVVDGACNTHGIDHKASLSESRKKRLLAKPRRRWQESIKREREGVRCMLWFRVWSRSRLRGSSNELSGSVNAGEFVS